MTQREHLNGLSEHIFALKKELTDRGYSLLFMERGLEILRDKVHAATSDLDKKILEDLQKALKEDE